MWGDRRCLYAYGAAPGAFFNDCLSPARYQVVGDYGFVQHAVPSFFYPSLAVSPASDVWLTAAWQRFGGELATEYGRQPNQAVFTAQWWF